MRIGFSFWGFLGPGIVDTPDGGRFWRRAKVEELLARGHDIVLLQADRDRTEAGHSLPYTWDPGFPDIDLLYCEWRWPLPGRNTTPCGTAGHTCDLHRQDKLISHYTHALSTPTVLWDTDRQITADEPLRRVPHVVVCDPAVHPAHGAVSVMTMIPDALIDAADPARLAARPRRLALAYVGNQYDRDQAFDKFFAVAAGQFPHRVAGKWTRTEQWPHVNFTGRCAFDEVTGIYQDALTTVLLMPDRYSSVGAISQRLAESVLAGCLPITPATLIGGTRITPPQLHAADTATVVERIRWAERIDGTDEHARVIADCLTHLDPLRMSRQVDVLEQVMTSLVHLYHR
ncbi:hypothetical protein AB0O34_07720 [Sphaerisporangium sp. NPDC088356]|uniref:hypothetical protein n=1 Tax=Sphaerisporangium sp. NPDC088356 TaxID=3154871 RepID=UPI003434F238